MLKPLVVGLSGVTSGGKSTLAKMLAIQFPGSMVMCQDLYFKLENQNGMEFVSELGHYNWDILSAIDMRRFEDDFHANTKLLEANSRALLIVEGFLILNYKPIADLVDLKYYFELGYEECWTRRQTRHYDPPDVPGYFQKIVWPMHLKHKKEAFDMYLDIRRIDGKFDIDKTYKNIVADIEDVLSVRSLK